MKEGLLYVLVGGLIGYGSSILNYIFAIRKQRKDEIWKEKIRIYSKVIEELGKSFLDLEEFPNSYLSPIEKTKFILRLGSILAPARLVASDELEIELRGLFDEEVAWFDTISNKNISENDIKEISERSIKIRYKVEQLMRKELK
jgi:hypothetical protein